MQRGSFSLSNVQVPLAQCVVRFLPNLGFGRILVVSRWAEIQEVLRRDLDFVIAPVNAERIERINGPFVLGMDRHAQHLAERNALYQALRHDDSARIGTFARTQAAEILDSVPSGATLDVVGGYARLIAARTASLLTGVSGPDETTRMAVIRALFHECFLNLGNDPVVRERAVAASTALRAWVMDEIAARQDSGEHTTQTPQDDMIGRLLTAGNLDSDTIRRTVSGMITGAIDTTATCVAYCVDVILRREKILPLVLADLDDPIRMRGWCYEALRLRPHNPIILRQSARDTELQGRRVRAGTTVVCFTLAGMHDPAAFPDSRVLDPGRPQDRYLHFGGGLHPCAGRTINDAQIPVLVTELLRRKPEILSPIQNEGPFPNTFITRLSA